MAYVMINAVLCVDEEALRDCSDEDDKGYSFSDTLHTEMGWLKGSGVTLESYEVVKDDK